MPPQGPMPTQIPQAPVNPMIMALLRARAAQGAQGVPAGAPMPNGLRLGTPAPAAPVAASVMGPRQGVATPTQQVTKAAQQAQSPLMDMETRNIAKSLVQKLLQHM